MAYLAKLFGLQRSGSLENPQVSLQDYRSWDDLFGDEGKSASGAKVNKKTVLRMPAFWQAVTLISGDLAKIPLNRYARRPDLGESGREIDRESLAYRLVRRAPNYEQNVFAFWRQLYVQRLVFNEAFVYIDRSPETGEPRNLLSLLSDRTWAERLKAADLIRDGVRPDLAREMEGQRVYVSEIGGKLQTFMPSQILHLQGISIDGCRAMRLLDAARDSMGKALARINFASRFFRNGGRIGGILEVPPASATNPGGFTKPAADTLVEGFLKHYSDPDKQFQAIVLRENAKFHEAQHSLQESQLKEIGEEDVREVARLFNLAPSKLGLSDSVSYNSKAEDNQAHLDSTLSPYLCETAAECDFKLRTAEESASDSHFYEHNVNAFLRLDALKRWQIYNLGLQRRVFLRNEVRAMENMPPVDGGDVFDPQPGSGSPTPPANPPAKPATEPAAEPEPEPDPAPSEEEQAQRNLRRRVVFHIGSRARDKAGNPSEFIHWVDGGLKFHRAEYRRLCGEDQAGEGALIDPIAEKLRSATERATAEQLPTIIDELMTQFETEAC